MARVEKTVFISYRRKDVSWALAVYQDLTHRGYDVFFDYTNIPSGDFEQIILSNIKARAHFVLILTPAALDRCSEPGDWLRREIELAIDEKRNIVPLFFDGFNFGNTSGRLTGKLQNVSRYNGMNVHQDYFLEAMDRLRNKFLNVPLNTVLHPVSTEVREIVEKEQHAANNAAKEAEGERARIERDARRRKQRESIRNFISLILSNSRRLGVGGLVLFALIFGGFGLNYLIKNLPIATATIFSLRDTPPMDPFTSTNVPFIPTIQLTESLTSYPIETSIPAPTLEVDSTNTATPEPMPTLGAGSTMISEKDGMVSLYVPASQFLMGSKYIVSYEANDEIPQHSVNLDAFWIDQTEVTNEMYAKCVDIGLCDQPSNTRYFSNSSYANHPVVYVDWDMANQYCSWRDNSRLPTEAEWEKAARGTDGRTYPWGESISCSNANYVYVKSGTIRFDPDFNSPCVGGTREVGSYEYSKSPYGVYDMSGNVWEWINDWYDGHYYKNSPESNPLGPDSGGGKVLRGGAWNAVTNYLRTSARFASSPATSTNYIGFRCARSP